MIWRRVTSLYARYAARALTIEGRTGPHDRTDISVLRLKDGLLELAGTAQDTPVILTFGPATARTDAAPGAPFSLSLTLPAGTDPRDARLNVGDVAQPLPWIGAGWAQKLTVLRFIWVLLTLLPLLISWLRRRDTAAKAQIKRALLLDAVVAGHDLPHGLFAERADEREAEPLTIVLPVYDAHDVLRECLDRVVRHTRGDWTMIVIDDASPDPRIRPMLEEFRDAHSCVELIGLDQNVGFVGAVNHGLQRAMSGAHKGAVVLLNSDALVPDRWDPRLLAPLSDASVASVTPMSNDAEIFGLPAICAPVSLRLGAGDSIDATAARLAPGQAKAVAPTGVGFCMALARSWLMQVPQLDTAFGRGYGEEVDWCQKVRALGGQHLGCATLFVEHRGGGSFGSDAKAALIAKNSATISRRYPNYDLEVQRFVASDPLAGGRLALACAWAETARGAEAVPIYLAHWMGGGADIWLRGVIEARSADGMPTIVVRVGGPCDWQLEVSGPGGTTACRTNDLSAVHDLLAPITMRRVIYSNGVGARYPLGLPAVLMSLAGEGPVDVLFHDYHALSQDFVLMRPRDRYRGPRVGEDRTGWQPPVDAEWDAAWRPLLEAAENLVCFSAESGRLLSLARPTLANKIDVRPHVARRLPAVIAPPASAPRVLASLGNLAEHKGAGVMADLSRGWKRRFPGAKLILLGDIDPSFSLSRDARLHGGYGADEIPDLARQYGITHWVIPSICPETFSFTTHEALSTGLPVLAFDIGGQGAAVTGADNGVPISWDPDADAAELLRRALTEQGF